MRKTAKFTFWGVRGSIPASGIDIERYGGHTSCSSIVSSSGEITVIDAGTGIVRLGDNLMKNRKGQSLDLSFLFTHFHLDHIQGLPFFAPLYSPRCRITFYSALNPRSAEACLNRVMGGRLFPVAFGETPSEKDFKKLPPHPFRIGNVQVSSCPLVHPQGSRAFRFQTAEGSVVLATDTEHPEKGLHTDLVSFCQEAGTLIYDAMFTPAEYRAGKKGWGHSTWLAGVKVAQEAGVGNLFLSHLNSWHADGKIEKIVEQARKKFPSTLAAQEGKRIVF